MTMQPLTTPATYAPCHYTTNRGIMNDPTVNVTFLEVLRMTDDEFLAWMSRVRHAILRQWDTHQVPPRVGMNDAEMADAWDHFSTVDASGVWVTTDDGTLGISAPPTAHSVVNQWFPTMMKTRITYGSTNTGMSIYDMFADDSIWQRYVESYAVRHFRRDSFYSYSPALKRSDTIPTLPKTTPQSVRDWLTLMRDHPTEASSSLFGESASTRYEVWLCPATTDETYSGYSDKMNARPEKRGVWTVDLSEAHALRDSGEFPSYWFRMVPSSLEKNRCIQIRMVNSTTRIFPHGFKSFRVSMCQYAVNWPAVGARALYEKYTTGIQNPVIWDPSSGWAGRLAGAVTARTRPLYIGCDPNTDHLWVDEAGVQHSKYTEIAAYHASRTPFDAPPKVLFFPCGSEVMKDQPEFQQYQGKVDVVFTSPPYFAKELYSDDPEQSARKFSEFEGWCEGFLKPTIETAAKWLKSGGVLLWNIADAKFGGKMLPLEQRSIDYAVGAGLVQQETIRLLMSNMPGGNRVKEDEAGNLTGTAKNTCFVNKRLVKFEPIFVFQKK